MLPGFHPDPSCIFVKEWDETFFCASSSFNAFPGIPIHASKDLQNWKLIGHVLNRREQLPRLAETNRSTSGIWAPALRYHKKTFYLVTTLVDDHLPQNDPDRWDNIIFRGKDPYKPSSWSVATHFKFQGYDPSPFWDTDGQSYINAAFAWQVSPGIYQAKVDLETGEVLSDWKLIWKGTGGMAPEGPHIYRKDGYYYLMAAEGGTGLGHMETIARSKSLSGPFESNPANPILTNANTSSLFQTVGHADLFQDGGGNWWGVALSTRSGPDYLYYPMGRETVLAPVTWKKGEWPYFTQISGQISGWKLPRPNRNIKGVGPFTGEGDDIDFVPGSQLPAHFTHWRFPIPDSYAVSPRGHPNTLRIKSSRLNLTALNGNYAGPEGQSFVSRRQQHTFFTYRVDLDFKPTILEEEAGITTFLTQNHQFHMGIVGLANENGKVVPHIRFRGESYVPVPDPVVLPVPDAWKGKTLTLEVKASNVSHYSFAVGPAGSRELQTIVVASNDPVSWGFTGVLLGVYCTTNGGAGKAEAYFSKWKYIPQGQLRE
ncbi:arabinofuranosidase [Coprinopsis cinerea okayama7|uniref:Arabinofuranosidase n=1 Tax=Coprinopsis cinerea (strain Okayama-7 / 130 / ATCC MYA-4618 / FGSC 9003) TaxID=240176 RepID=A8NTS7_COPC7|nr:arabinofuranosidase [Coprinopsis cinerea okayama7\|eukprot:XP_001836293.2 arabinofuranosidase [Coprinopsis cinerea okayama7\